MIYKNSILYLSDLTDLSDLVIVRNQPGPPGSADGIVYLPCQGFRVQCVTGAAMVSEPAIFPLMWKTVIFFG